MLLLINDTQHGGRREQLSSHRLYQELKTSKPDLQRAEDSPWKLRVCLRKRPRGMSMTFSPSLVRLKVEIVRSGECACTAYVTFKDSYSQETACLLSGATINDQSVCITRWGHYQGEFDFWNRSQSRDEDESHSNHPPPPSQNVPSAGEVASIAQEVVMTMLSKGYVLGKDALAQAKTFDESHQVSATAAARVAELSERFGLTDKFCAGVEAIKSVNERYHVSEITKSAVSGTGRKAAEAATAVVNSSYFSKGALWMSGALNRAAKAAADLGSRNGTQ